MEEVKHCYRNLEVKNEWHTEDNETKHTQIKVTELQAMVRVLRRDGLSLYECGMDQLSLLLFCCITRWSFKLDSTNDCRLTCSTRSLR